MIDKFFFATVTAISAGITTPALATSTSEPGPYSYNDGRVCTQESGKEGQVALRADPRESHRVVGEIPGGVSYEYFLDPHMGRRTYKGDSYMWTLIWIPPQWIPSSRQPVWAAKEFLCDHRL